ncbi:hypothetical protein D046_7798B, partial [Vibrio parahaemolyticus V-223/04]
DVQLVRR